MSSKREEDRDMRELWIHQKTEGIQMSIEEVRNKARRFQQKIQRRNLLEYVAALANFVLFGRVFFHANDLLVRLGCGLVLTGTAYIVWHLLTKGSPGVIGENAGLTTWIAFRRQELIRQRDLLASIWRWYLGPLIPGLVVLVAGSIRANRLHGKHLEGFIAFLVLSAIGFTLIPRVNMQAARKLQQQIDDLDRESGTGASESA